MHSAHTSKVVVKRARLCVDWSVQRSVSGSLIPANVRDVARKSNAERRFVDL